MTPLEKQSAIKNKGEFLRNLIIEFFHFVKSQSEEDTEAHVKADAKFRSLDDQWRRVCQAKDCKFMKLRNDAFQTEVFKLINKPQENMVGIKTDGKVIKMEANGL